MIYDVEFSLDAAAELLKITEVVGSAMLVLRAADQIRRHLENDPADKGAFLSEGLRSFGKGIRYGHQCIVINSFLHRLIS